MTPIPARELEQRIIADLEESLRVPEGSPAPRCIRVLADCVPPSGAFVQRSRYHASALPPHFLRGTTSVS